MISFSIFDACVTAMLLGVGGTVVYFRGPGLVRQLARRVWRQVRTLQRRLVLEPNMDSKVLVEEYVFALSHSVVLGVPTEFEMVDSPDVTIRVQSIRANVDAPGLFVFRDMRVTNISTIVGGEIDAAQFNRWSQIDWPTMTPANKARAFVRYTGKIPAGFKDGDRYMFCLSMRGPAGLCS
jgi:hypothetical protein